MRRPWEHWPNDGRGPRQVLLDGKEISRVVFADERRGLVLIHDEPLRLTKNKDRIIPRKKWGRVEIRPL